MQILLPHITAAKEPEKALLKWAQARRWEPAILERIAQTYNQLKTLNVLDKSASVEDRGRTFPILDVPGMLSEYVTHHPVSDNSSASSAWFDSIGPAGVKLAADASVQYYDQAPNWLGDLTGKSLDVEAMPMKKEAAAPKQTYWEVRPQLKKLAHEIRTLTTLKLEAGSQILASFSKLAKMMESKNIPLVDVLQDTKVILRENSEPVLSRFTTYCKTAGLVRGDLTIPEDTRILGQDRHNIDSEVKSASDNIGLILAYEQLQKELATEHKAKMAAFDSDDFDSGVSQAIDADKEELEYSDPSTTGTDGEPLDPFIMRRRAETAELTRSEKAREDGGTKPEDDAKKKIPANTPTPSAPSKGETGGLSRGGVAGSALSKLESGRDRMVKDVMSVSADRAQQHKGLRFAVKNDLVARTTLARLLLNDPILSKANPRSVISLYNTIRKANPAVAADPNLLSITLREAVAQDGLALHEYKQLLDSTANNKPSDKNKPSVNVNFLGI